MTDQTEEQTAGAVDDAVDDSGADNKAQTRQRLALVIGLAVLLIAFGFVYLIWATTRVNDDLADREARAQELVDDFEAELSASQITEPTPTPAPTAVAAAEPGFAPLPGEVLVVNRVPGDDYGRLAIRHADGSRTLLERSCLRVHLAGPHGACLSQDESLVPSYTTTFFPSANPALEIKSYASALPSRVRISPEGTFSSVTAFVSGTSYADISSETTTLVTIDEIISTKRLRGAGSFLIDSTDERYLSFDAQYWGMTFADENEFYLTGFYGDEPEIMHGTLDDMTIAPTGWIGSCPSLSPDGKTLVFKELRDDGGFDLVAVDVATQEKTLVNETRSADDQVEWLDNDTILYALHPEGGDVPVQPEFDIWMIDISPGAEPELFLPNADSPAVFR